MRKFHDSPSARDRIIEAYLRLLTKGGRGKVTVSAVVKSAGCNRDTFYYHFPSLDGAAQSALDELAPRVVPLIARTLIEGGDAAIPASAKRKMLLAAKVVRAHPSLRRHLEEALKRLWISELRIDAAAMGPQDEAVLDFMAAGTVGFACGHLADAGDGAEFDAAFLTIARTFGKSALDYAEDRKLTGER